ncbi:MAG: hypothetical protein U0703_17325 [Anaerolineae bacterium]
MAARSPPANALYLACATRRVGRRRCADLPTVPSNQAGRRTIPPSSRRRHARSSRWRLPPTSIRVRVHLRRVPSVEGDPLALVPAGTQMELLGVNEDRDWVFVRYTAPQSNRDRVGQHQFRHVPAQQ